MVAYLPKASLPVPRTQACSRHRHTQGHSIFLNWFPSLITRRTETCILCSWSRLDYCNTMSCRSRCCTSTPNSSLSSCSSRMTDAVTRGLHRGITQCHRPLEFPRHRCLSVVALYKFSCLASDLEKFINSTEHIVSLDIRKCIHGL